MTYKHGLKRSFVRIAITLAALVLVAPRADAEVKLTTSNKTTHEISGGAGAKVWKLVYGSSSADSAKPILHEVSSTRAYFALSTWVRLIDTENGMVIGRWLLPGEIIDIKPVAGDFVDIVCNESPGRAISFNNTYRLDPAHPQLPRIMPDNLLQVRSPRSEPLPTSGPYPLGALLAMPADVQKAKEALAMAREQARRDPLSPYFRLSEAHLLKVLSDPAADQAYDRVLEVPLTNWIEWFQLSATLEQEGRHDLFNRAFEQAYADYWRSGNDPRLLMPLITRLILFNPWSRQTPTGERRLENVDKIYHLMPYGEGAPLAWQVLARELEKTGPPDAAALWRARADDAHDREASFGAFVTNLDLAFLALIAALLAAALYAMAVNRRYTAQNHYDMAAGKRQWSFLSIQNIVYWSRRERFSFIVLFVIVWISFGYVGAYLQAELRIAASPISVYSGNFAGSIAQWHIGRLPASPERDLLLAQAYLQSGKPQEAEALYRKTPRFAESWNNLGVILQQSGRTAEARTAYERALQLDPQLHEAELNLGRGAKDLWTQLHQQYVPNAPMLAPPRAQLLRAAYLGGSGLRYWLPTLLQGVLWTRANARGIALLGGLASDLPGPSWIAVLAGIVLLAYTVLVILLLVLPYREVTQPPSRGQTVLELVLPGASPAWNALGGLVLGAAITLLMQTCLYWKFGTPRLLSFVAMPNIVRAYLASGDFNVFDLINPSRFWLYAAPVLLWAINAVLVLAPWRRSSPKPTPAAAVEAS